MKTSVARDVYTFYIILQNYASPDNLPSLLLVSSDLIVCLVRQVFHFVSVSVRV